MNSYLMEKYKNPAILIFNIIKRIVIIFVYKKLNKNIIYRILIQIGIMK